MLAIRDLCIASILLWRRRRRRGISIIVGFTGPLGGLGGSIGATVAALGSCLAFGHDGN